MNNIKKIVKDSISEMLKYERNSYMIKPETVREGLEFLLNKIEENEKILKAEQYDPQGN